MKRIAWLLLAALLVFSTNVVYGKNLLVGFVLDETGSMMERKVATINSFNEYLFTLKDREENISMTLTKFNSLKGTRVVFKTMDMYYIAGINIDTYCPNAMTPLYDAIGQTINSIDVEKDTNVLFVVLTDGLENASQEYTRRAIFDLIKDKECEGWTFVFLGADQDSYVAESMGFRGGNILIWDSITDSIATPMRNLIKCTDSFLDTDGIQTTDFFNEDSVKVE